MVRALFLSFLLTSLSACAVSTDLEGPGLDAEGALIANGDGSIYIAVTEAVVRADPASQSRFFELAGAVVDGLDQVDGYIAHALRVDLVGTRRWTMTKWEDAGAMTVFNFDPTHQTAIRESAEMLAGGRTASAPWPRDAGLPTWEDAEAVLDEYGRSILR